jgi:pimeloyl-ACP methyl ester carboxylesterase
MIGVLALAVTTAVVQTPADTFPVRRVEVAPDELIAIRDVGAGQPIVIVPGLLGSAYGFRHVIPELVEAGHRVVVVDPLGTGGSPAPEDADYSLTAQAERVRSVVGELGIGRAVFLCHSTGGAICYRLALRDPGMVASIVSINGGPTERLSTPGLGLALKLAPILKLFGGKGRARGKVRDGLKDSSIDPSWVTDDVVAGYTAHYNDFGLDRILGTLKRMSDAREPDSLAPALPRLVTRVRLLLGRGERPGAVPPDQLAALYTVPRLEVDSLPDVGQYIQEEEPEAVIAATLEMARRAAAEAPHVVAGPGQGQFLPVRLSTARDTIRN